MKPHVLLCTVCLLLAALGPLRAQESLTALAERQQWEERVNTMNARLEKLEESIQLYQQRMNKLNDEIRSVREELARANNSGVNAATQKSLELLANAVKEVDRKRMADNEKVLNALNELQKGLLNKSNSSRSAPKDTPPPRAASPAKDGYEYTVQAGDNASVIASKVKKNGVNITPQQIIDANPGVAWNRLKVGAKIFIPAP